MASSVVSRVAGLGALTAAGQLLIIGTLPLYSRLFEPATYGQFVIFVGVFTVVSVLAGVRYDSAIVLPRSDTVARSLSLLVVLIALAVAAMVAVVTATASLLHTGEGDVLMALPASNFGYGLAVATMLGAVQRCLTSWCVRRGSFLTIGWGQFVFCLATVVAQLSLLRVLAPLPALIWGYAAALTCQILCLRAGQRRAIRPAGTSRDAIRGMLLAARKYRRFPTYMVGYALASSARDRLLQIVIGIGAGAAAVGRFGLAYRVAFAPNSLIYSAVSPVFYGIASRSGPLAVGRFAGGLVESLFVVLVVPYVAFAIEAPALTDAVLAEKWHGTGPYLTALAGPALLLAATCWLDRAFDSFRRQHVAFLLEASFTAVVVALMALLSRLVDPLTMTWAFASLALVYYWIYFLATFVACGFDLGQFRHACVSGVSAVAMALVLGILVHLELAPVWRGPAYVAVMAAVVLTWIKLRGGTALLRTLIESRVHSPPSEVP
jgi:O-antigen/teichoic acid export membrane protein